MEIGQIYLLDLFFGISRMEINNTENNFSIKH